MCQSQTVYFYRRSTENSVLNLFLLTEQESNAEDIPAYTMMLSRITEPEFVL